MKNINLIVSGNLKAQVVKEKERLLEVGSNMRKWRSLRGYKQEILADALEISKVSVSKIENGKTDIPLSRLFEIAYILGLPIEFLFCDPNTKINFRI